MTIPALRTASLPGQATSALTAKVAAHPEVGGNADLANAIVEQTLAFLTACSLRPDMPLSPSRMVDIGWHELILRTRDYAALCGRLGGFIHHDPTDGRAEGYTAGQTVQVMLDLGLHVDPALWPDSAKCAGGPDGPGQPCTKGFGVG